MDKMKKAILILIIFGLLVLAGCGEQTSTGSEQTTSEPELIEEVEEELELQEQNVSPPIQEIDYEIIEEEDISYAGCKRIALRITVPDDTSKEDVDSVLKEIIEEREQEWEDITVWAWKDSEKQDVGKIIFTMGMKEYSICD